MSKVEKQHYIFFCKYLPRFTSKVVHFITISVKNFMISNLISRLKMKSDRFPIWKKYIKIANAALPLLDYSSKVVSFNSLNNPKYFFSNDVITQIIFFCVSEVKNGFLRRIIFFSKNTKFIRIPISRYSF